MKLLVDIEMASVPDLRHRLRHLSWFRGTFRDAADAVTKTYGIRYTIDDEALTHAFLDWIDVIDAKKALAKIDRADFIIFGGGLVLSQLIGHNPATATRLRPDPQALAEQIPDIIDFWPEGFLYTNYCISAISALFEQEFGEMPEISACADDLRMWWSYKENSLEMPSYAVAFFDRFLNREPNWDTPATPEQRKPMLLK